ncbi:uncharacterized protein LOC131332679 [Rhododendron vialii]|uniref:uncharacterized protein LOC131332679 n=1 Tax=Rhododendron vialii TaxID=182163 RepID=UPI00265EAC72|nr:uncharacterized protein LOC131332679 [Rhododendron vialii]
MGFCSVLVDIRIDSPKLAESACLVMGIVGYELELIQLKQEGKRGSHPHHRRRRFPPPPVTTLPTSTSTTKTQPRRSPPRSDRPHHRLLGSPTLLHPPQRTRVRVHYGSRFGGCVSLGHTGMSSIMSLFIWRGQWREIEAIQVEHIRKSITHPSPWLIRNKFQH